MTLDSRRQPLGALALRVLLALALIFNLIAPPISSAQVGEAVTLVAVLDQLQARLDRTINNARNSGLELELVLGAQIAAQITLARQELATELEQQRREWSSTAEQIIDKLTQSINDLGDHLLAKAQNLVDQGQLLLLSLPLHDETPRVRAFTPIVSFRPRPGVDDLVYSVAGVFPDFGRAPKYIPALKLDVNGPDGHPLPPIPASSGTALSAVFHVPGRDLIFPNSAMRTIQAHINIRYRKRCALLFHCDSEASIPELIGLLPPSPGNLHLSFSITSEVYVTRMSTSYVIHQDAGAGDDLDHRQV